MWVATEPDNVAAQRTYVRAGARVGSPAAIVDWRFPAADPG
jgi:hypothetical protein